jgi:hypothetical protein
LDQGGGPIATRPGWSNSYETRVVQQLRDQGGPIATGPEPSTEPSIEPSYVSDETNARSFKDIDGGKGEALSSSATSSPRRPEGPEAAASPRTQRKPRAPSDPEGFAEFYVPYPRHEDRAKAVKAFASAVKAGANREDIARGSRAYAADMEARKVESQYIKLPATWLNGRCWENYAATAADPAKPPPMSKEEVDRRIAEHHRKEAAKW